MKKRRKRFCRPAGPYHDFVLLRHEASVREALDRIRLSDDVLRHCLAQPLLFWIDTEVEVSTEKLSSQRGINYYGPTIFRNANLEGLAVTFESWKALVRLGPMWLRVTGSLRWQCGKDGEDIPGSAEFDRYLFERDSIASTFDRIAVMARTAQKNPDELYVLHLGI